MACFYAPSIAVYREMVRHGQQRPTGNFLAFANPPPRDGDATAEAKLRDREAGALPDAEREVENGVLRRGLPALPTIMTAVHARDDDHLRR